MKRIGVGAVVVVLGLLLAGCAGLFNKPPVAEFTWNPVQPYAGQEVFFDASASYDPDENDTLTYSWIINGEHFSGMVVRYTFPDNGVYNVTLNVTDKCNVSSSSVTKQVTVLNPTPEIEGIRISDCDGGRIEAGDRLRFCVEATDPAMLDPNFITEIKWDFGDGSAYEHGQCVEHCYPQAGRYYTVQVFVKDDDGAVTSLQGDVYVYPKDFPPTAAFSVNPSEIHLNDIVTLDASSSHDNDCCYVPCDWCRDCAENTIQPSCHSCICDGTDRVVSYKWTIWPPTGSTFVIWGGKVNFRAEQTGSYTIRLQVKDDENNWSSTSTTIEVQP